MTIFLISAAVYFLFVSAATWLFGWILIRRSAMLGHAPTAYGKLSLLFLAMLIFSALLAHLLLRSIL